MALVPMQYGTVNHWPQKKHPNLVSTCFNVSSSQHIPPNRIWELKYEGISFICTQKNNKITWNSKIRRNRKNMQLTWSLYKLRRYDNSAFSWLLKLARNSFILTYMYIYAYINAWDSFDGYHMKNSIGYAFIVSQISNQLVTLQWSSASSVFKAGSWIKRNTKNKMTQLSKLCFSWN